MYLNIFLYSEICAYVANFRYHHFKSRDTPGENKITHFEILICEEKFKDITSCHSENSSWDMIMKGTVTKYFSNTKVLTSLTCTWEMLVKNS